MKIEDLRDYQVPLTEGQLKSVDKRINEKGFLRAFDKQLHYLDCTRWNKAHTYRLQQTIGYPYMYEMSIIFYMLDTASYDERLCNAVLKVHQRNLEYEKVNPPVIYDKKKGLAITEKTFGKRKVSNNGTSHKRRNTDTKETSAARRLAAHVAKINKLNFKIKAVNGTENTKDN